MELSVARPVSVGLGLGLGGLPNLAAGAQEGRLEDVFAALSLVLASSSQAGAGQGQGRAAVSPLPSPSPSASSESSGIGSLGSVKSDSLSLPSSPHDTCKKIFEEPAVPPKPQFKPKPVEVKVVYRGRNLLDLSANIRDPQWQYRPARLPQNSPSLFFANRSQYHRLGPFGTRTQYATKSCPKCCFESVVAVKETE